MLRAKLATLLAWPAGWTTSPLMVGGSTTLAAVLVMPPALSTQPTISWTIGSAQAQAQVVGGVDRLPQIGTGVAKDSVEGSETDHLRSKTSVPEEEQPMRNLINTAAVLTTLAISGVAAAPAQAKPSAARVWKQDVSDQDADEAARVSAGEGQQTTSYIFDADTLEGEVLNPDGTMIMHRRSPRMPSMLVLRGHFVPELLRLGSDI
jgi:hypothetical protein